MEEAALKNETSETTQVPTDEKEDQKPGMCSGQLGKPWCDQEVRKPWSEQEIWSFLDEWEILERAAHLRVRNNLGLAKVIARRLRGRGVQKGWKKCFQMLRGLQDLYWTICEANRRPRSEPLPCPYGEALHRILGPQSEHADLTGPLCDSHTQLPAPEYQPYLPAPEYQPYLPAPEYQPYLPAPVYQPQAWGVPVPLKEPLWVPPQVLLLEYPGAPGWEVWNVPPPWATPYPAPAVPPGALAPQQQWSTSD